MLKQRLFIPGRSKTMQANGTKSAYNWQKRKYSFHTKQSVNNTGKTTWTRSYHQTTTLSTDWKNVRKAPEHVDNSDWDLWPPEEDDPYWPEDPWFDFFEGKFQKWDPSDKNEFFLDQAEIIRGNAASSSLIKEITPPRSYHHLHNNTKSTDPR